MRAASADVGQGVSPPMPKKIAVFAVAEPIAFEPVRKTRHPPGIPDGQ